MKDKIYKSKDNIKEDDISSSSKSFYLKAQSAIEVNNLEYAVDLIISILSDYPGFLIGRKKLRSVETRIYRGKKKGGFKFDFFKMMKIQGVIKKDSLKGIQLLESEIFLNDPYDINANELLYNHAVKVEFFDTAEFALDTIIEGNPNELKYYHKLGDFCVEHKKFKKASEIFKKIVDKDRTDLLASKKYKDAAAQESITSQNWESDNWRDVLKNKDNSNALEQEEKISMNADMISTKIKGFLDQYNNDNSNLEAIKQLSSLYEKSEDFTSSLKFYKILLNLKGSDIELEKKILEIGEKEANKNIGELEKLIYQTNDPVKLQEYKGKLQEYKKSNLLNKVSLYQQKVNSNPTDNDFRYELGKSMYEVGDYKSAIQHLQLAKKSPSIRIEVMNILGMCYGKMGMNDLAVSQLEEAISELEVMDDTKKSILYNSALIYESIGDSTKYLNALKQIYSVDYGFRDVSDRVEKSYSEKKE